MRDSIAAKKRRRKRKISFNIESKINLFWKKIKIIQTQHKKKEEKTLEDKLKARIKKEISDAVEKVVKDKKTERNFNPAYRRFGKFVNSFYGPRDAFEEQGYGTKVDYEKLFSYLGSGSGLKKEGYNLELGHSEVSEKGVMSTHEAETTIRKIQYNIMMKSVEKIDIKEKERFLYWQEFNKVWLMFYHKNSAVRTDEVNYGAVNQTISM